MPGLMSLMLSMATSEPVAPMTGLNGDLGFSMVTSELAVLNLSQQQVEGYQ